LNFSAIALPHLDGSALYTRFLLKTLCALRGNENNGSVAHAGEPSFRRTKKIFEEKFDAVCKNRLQTIA